MERSHQKDLSSSTRPARLNLKKVRRKFHLPTRAPRQIRPSAKILTQMRSGMSRECCRGMMSRGCRSRVSQSLTKLSQSTTTPTCLIRTRSRTSESCATRRSSLSSRGEHKMKSKSSKSCSSKRQKRTKSHFTSVGTALVVHTSATARRAAAMWAVTTTRRGQTMPLGCAHEVANFPLRSLGRLIRRRQGRLALV